MPILFPLRLGDTLDVPNGGRGCGVLSFGVTVLPDPPYARLVDAMLRAGVFGFESGWTYDSHVLWQESFALLRLAAAATRPPKLGHRVTNPGIAEPTVNASWYATM